MLLTDPIDNELTKLRAFGVSLQTRSDEIEIRRRLPDDVVESLVDLGVFRLWVPDCYGGREAPVMDGLRVIEELGFWDGSVGWCAMIGATTATLSGFLPEPAAREIYADPRVVTGGVAAPLGVARRSEGGPSEGAVVVSGHWPWGSGTQHCQWIVGGCRLPSEMAASERATSKEAPAKAGPPSLLIAFFEASQVSFLDTWHVAGLCGTGSTDFEVNEALVPEGRWVGLLESEPIVDRPLYRFPRFGLLALGVASVCLGLARRAIVELSVLAVDRRYAGSSRALAQRSEIQREVAESKAGVAASWALIEQAVEEAERRAVDGVLDVTSRVKLRQAATFAATQSRIAVDRMYHAAGGAAVYRKSPLQRVFRDLHVAIQHQMVAPRTYELLGRIALGLDTNTSQL